MSIEIYQKMSRAIPQSGNALTAKGLDTGDKVLAHALASRMIHALRQQWRRGLLTGEGKVKGARVWALKP
jgi:hypothetical protein